jgi:hypothetical protein
VQPGPGTQDIESERIDGSPRIAVHDGALGRAIAADTEFERRARPVEVGGGRDPMTASMLRLACASLLSIVVSGRSWAAPSERMIPRRLRPRRNLQAALRRAGPGHTDRVIGTCQGVFYTTGELVELVGRSPAESRIANSALPVFGPGQMILRNLALVSSGRGLDVEGPGRLVSVEDCEIADNIEGILVERDARLVVRRSRVHSNTYGIMAGGDVSVFVIEGSLRDNSMGVYLGDKSRLELQNTELRGNDVGVLAQTLCSVVVSGTTFLDNGDAHIGVTDRSTVELADSIVGQPGDPTGVSLGADIDSRIGIYFQAPGTIYGPLYALQGSKLTVQGATLHDGVKLQDFSWAKLTDATVLGTVLCQTGSDTICAENSSAAVSGCGPVSASCSGAPAPSLETPRFLKAPSLDHGKKRNPELTPLE